MIHIDGSKLFIKDKVTIKIKINKLRTGNPRG